MRLLPIAREKGLIHPNQCGSLPGLSTSDAVAALRHDIGTAHRRGLKASSLMLDVKGGFDNVHPSLLAARLRRAGIPLSLRAWISSFLTDRTVALVFRGGPRDFLPAFMGTPQGSPLSPLLFLIYVSCFHRTKGKGSMFSYVDDFSLTVWSPSYRANTRHLRCWAEDLRYQAAKIRLDFSLPKTELIHWRTNQQSGTRCTRPITVGGITTNPMRVVRWLGFWLEDNSSTVSHFTRRLALAAAALTTVKGLSQYGKRSKSESLPPHCTSTRSTHPLIWCEPPHPHEGSPSQDGRPMAQGGPLGHHLLLPHQHLSTPGRGLSTPAQYHHRRPTGRIYRTHCGYFPIPEPRFR